MAGLHGVADTSRPCSPLDLVRSPAERLESTRFAKCVLPLSLETLPFTAHGILERVTRLISDLDEDMETVRERVFM